MNCLTQHPQPTAASFLYSRKNVVSDVLDALCSRMGLFSHFVCFVQVSFVLLTPIESYSFSSSSQRRLVDLHRRLYFCNNSLLEDSFRKLCRTDPFPISSSSCSPHIAPLCQALLCYVPSSHSSWPSAAFSPAQIQIRSREWSFIF